MPKFRKRPVVIEAWQWTFQSGCPDAPPWMMDALNKFPEAGSANFLPDGNKDDPQPRIEVNTLEGKMVAVPGDWIIRGVKGELYPCKPDIFALTYEAVEADAFELGRAVRELGLVR